MERVRSIAYKNSKDFDFYRSYPETIVQKSV